MKLNGFSLICESKIKESGITARLFRHNRSGAELVHIPCDDENKMFAVSFRTEPSDDSGVAHIIEHTVLSGSEKYPVKELFANLAKSSMNTYLNAMTMQDYTLFAVASRNEKDYMNLVRTYTDSVFRPLIYKNRLSFMQEGWSFDIDERKIPYYTGVVFNEMKGSFASPDMRLMTEANKALFSGTYACCSGGDPKAIVDLTYEKFLDFHREFYQPSNARFFVYGNTDASEVTELLNREYLGTAGSLGEESGLCAKMSEGPYEPKYIEGSYPSSEKYNIACIDFVIGDSDDMLRNFAAKVLVETLFVSDSSVLRSELISSGLCQDMFALLDDSRPESVISIEFYGVEDTNSKKLEERFLAELSKLDINAMKDDFLAVLEYMEFKLREADHGHAPKGFIYCIPLLTHELSEKDPFERLRFEKPIAELRKIIEDEKLQVLMEEYFFVDHRVCIILKADPEMLDREAAQEEDRAFTAWEALNDTEKKKKSCGWKN